MLKYRLIFTHYIMIAKVDKDLCIGCGLCASLCPDVFEIESDDLAGVIVDVVAVSDEDAAEESRDSCPVEAISIED